MRAETLECSSVEFFLCSLNVIIIGVGGYFVMKDKMIYEDLLTFTEYMNERSRNGMTTGEAAWEIADAANSGIIKKEDQLNYMFLYG